MFARRWTLSVYLCTVVSCDDNSHAVPENNVEVPFSDGCTLQTFASSYPWNVHGSTIKFRHYVTREMSTLNLRPQLFICTETVSRMESFLIQVAFDECTKFISVLNLWQFLLTMWRICWIWVEFHILLLPVVKL